jgi:DNA-binding MarR family transcriptional regulator
MNQKNRMAETVIDTASLVHRSVSGLLRALRVRKQGEGLSATKLAVLGRLHREGQTTAVELAEYLRVQPQSLTRLLDDLERRGFITRRPSSVDRRQVCIAISGQGVKALTNAIKEEREVLARAIQKSLTPTELELLRFSVSLIDKLARELGGPECDDE